MTKRDAFIDRLPVIRLRPIEFTSLSEYSCSLPTGTTPGKRWRRLDGAFDHAWKAAGGVPRWIVGEYAAIPGDPKNIKINWYRPVICIPATMNRFCEAT